VNVSWPAVPNAVRYRIERALQVGGAAAWTTIVDAPTTSYVDTTPASTLPVTYIYYVRALDTAGTASDRGGFDDATTATALYRQANVISGVTDVEANDLVELRRAVDAYRYAVNLGPAFQGASAPSGLIYATHVIALVDALNAGRTAVGRSLFAYANVPVPVPGVLIYAEHLRQLREALK
jgi:hypothetical protein